MFESRFGLATLKQREGDDVALGDVAGVVDVQVVAAVVGGQDLRGVVGVTDGLVEIDDAIEFAAGANPGVHFLANLLVLRAVEAVIERITEKGVLEGRNRRADGADSLFVSAGDELAIAVDQVLGGQGLGRRYERTREEQVIDAEGEDHVFHARLREHIAIEASEA